jgi:hypothetical protein
MAIGRMQMNRQLYGLGGYFPPENGREKFGLGSKLKKFVRKIIPNEVSEIAVKAAPFVAPFNPLLAGYMAGIGGFDQTGRIGSSLKSGLLTYGGGQLARGIGGAGFQEGFNPFSNVSFSGGIMSGLGQTFTSPVSGAPLFGQSVTPVQPTITPTQQAITSGTGDIDQFTSIQDYLAQTDPKNPLLTEAQRASEIAKQAGKTLSERTATTASRGYTDLLKSVVSPDSTLIERGQAVMDLGGKALKDIYTNKDGDLDKSAVIATLSMIPSYLDAKKAADDAGIEGFDEATYNAERDKYMERYKTNLPASSFGIQAAANGGRIGYKEGTPREGIVSLTDEDSGVIYRDPKTGEPLTTTEFLRRAQEDEDRENQEGEDKELDYGASSITLPKKKTFRERTMEIAVPKQINRELEDKFENYLKKLVTGKKDGGRMGYADGTSPQLSMAADMIKKGMDVDTISSITELTVDQINQIKQGMTQPVQKAEGGRTGFLMGSLVRVSDFAKPSEGQTVQPLGTIMPSPINNSGGGGLGLMSKLISQNPNLFKTTPVNMTRGTSVNQLYNYYKDKEFDPEEEKRKQILDLYMRDNAATGGRMGFMMGTEVPMRQNQGGITELDYRKTGGFVPVGVKERADDVPAMLSKNEFVFTADAVRGAGKGDINKGAKMMYAKMKALEGKVKKFKKTKKKKVKV